MWERTAGETGRKTRKEREREEGTAWAASLDLLLDLVRRRGEVFVPPVGMVRGTGYMIRTSCRDRVQDHHKHQGGRGQSNRNEREKAVLGGTVAR